MSRTKDIDESLEWKLLSGLCQQGHRLALFRPLRSRQANTKLISRVEALGIELRVLQVTSTDVIIEALDQGYIDITEAKSELALLCTMLDRQVNPECLDGGGVGSNECYSRLVALVAYLEAKSRQSMEFEFELLQGPQPTLLPVLFIISPEPQLETVYRKIMIDQTAALQRDGAEEKLLERAKEFLETVTGFNRFVRKLSLVPAPEQIRTAWPSKRPPRVNSTAQQMPATLSENYFQLTLASSLEMIISNFSRCSKAQHQVLFQIPSWYHATVKAKSRAGIKFILSSCLEKRKRWQHAEFTLGQITEDCESYTLCEAIDKGSYNGNRLLEILVDEAAGTQSELYIDTVPVLLSAKLEPNGLAPKKNLSDLIRSRHFLRVTEFSFYQKYKVEVFTLEERKKLALKLFLCFLLSIDLKYDIDVWDAHQIFFTRPSVDGRGDPYIACNFPGMKGGDDTKKSDLDRFDVTVFTVMAQFLTELAIGYSWYKLTSLLKVDENSPSHFHIIDKVESFIHEHKDGIDTAQFLSLAKRCLSLEPKFLRQVKAPHNLPPGDHTSIAKRLVYQYVIRMLDTSLPTAPSFITQPFSKIKASNPQPVSTVSKHDISMDSGILCTPDSSVKLFQIESSNEAGKDIESSRQFFKRLSEFRESCKSYGIEEPIRRVRIAILDTGIDLNHQGIQALTANDRLKGFYDWTDSYHECSDNDEEKHGTHCAYLLHKVAPEADIYVAKVFNENKLRLQQAQNIAAAIRHAVETWDVDIISMSFGLQRPSSKEAMPAYEAIIDDIESAIIASMNSSPRLIFAAASNKGRGYPRTFPASFREHVICIHASTGNGANGDINPEVYPGDSFMTLGIAVELIEGGKFAYKSGTSFATPIAAGLAANILHLAATCGKLLTDRTKRKLQTTGGMRTMFDLMATPEKVAGDYRFVATWVLWEENWQSSEKVEEKIWSRINSRFGL